MKHLNLIPALIFLIAATAAHAVDAPASVSVKAKVNAYEVRDYKVGVTIKGSMTNPDTKQPMQIDSAMTFKIKHKYNRREGDGLLPMEVSLTEGDVTMAGQTLRISPSIYPRLTVLLDKTFRVDDIFGFADTAPGALPGINYGNMTMLFHVPGLSTSRSTGESWESKVLLPTLKEAYSVKNTLKAVSKPDQEPATVTLAQEYTRVPLPNSTTPPPLMRATVESVFFSENGKLLESHVECSVVPPQPKDSKAPASEAHRAIIKMDISLIK